MPRIAIAIFTRLPDHVLSEVFAFYLYSAHAPGTEIEYDDVYAESSPHAVRRGNFVRAILPASLRFYDIAIRVLWRCVVVRDSISLGAVAERTSAGGFRTRSVELASLTRRFELRLPQAYETGLVQDILGRMDDLHVLVVRNHPLRSGRGYRPTPLHLLRPLQTALHRVLRIQFDTELVLPAWSDIMGVLYAKPTMETLRIAHFHPSQSNSPLWTPPTTQPIVSHLTTLSLGALEPRGRPAPNEFISSFLSTVVEHLPLPNLRTLDIFEESEYLPTFLRTYGFQLDRLAYAAPTRREEAQDDGWIDDCPNLEELVWVMRGWFTVPPPSEGHDNVSKVAIYYIKDALEDKWDCLEQLRVAVRVFHGGAYGGLSALEVVVRGEKVPDYQACAWLDERVDTVQVLSGNNGWTVDVGLDG